MNVMSTLRCAKFAARRRWPHSRSRLRQAAADQTAGMGGGAAVPGSQQDFVVNVGDRVFFETRLRPSSRRKSRATLDKQAQWLNQLQSLCLHHRRSRRRARHARIQYRARRPSRADGAGISGLARRRGAAHAHHLLRQGAAGRGVQRHLLLVAEPPRRDRAQSELVGVIGSGPDFVRADRARSWTRASASPEGPCSTKDRKRDGDST